MQRELGDAAAYSVRHSNSGGGESSPDADNYVLFVETDGCVALVTHPRDGPKAILYHRLYLIYVYNNRTNKSGALIERWPVGSTWY